MSYLSKMYGIKTDAKKVADKNPNRVAGGLRAQGMDHFELLGEDGSVQQVPSQRYVQSLEEQIKKQRATIETLDRRLKRAEVQLTNISLSSLRP